MMSANEEPEVPSLNTSAGVLLCPQCQAHNDPALERCSVCGADLRPGRSGRHRLRTLLLALAALAAVVAFVVLPLLAIVPRLAQKRAAWPTATALPSATVTTVPPLVFNEDVFSFRYPVGWWRIGPGEAAVVRLQSFQDLVTDMGSYVGGVFAEGLDHCADCAQIVVSVAQDASLTGMLTEAQYQQLHAASVRALGARLLSQRRTEVASRPAVESVYLDPSSKTRVWEFLIVPPQAGLAYRVSCSSHVDSFATFEPVFQQAMASLHIAGEVLASGPTRVPFRTPTPVPVLSPTPVKTYKVQAGDVLGVIARNLGVTVEALAQANGLEEPYIIHPGDVLTVPLGTR
jgi:hypothetical protein